MVILDVYIFTPFYSSLSFFITSLHFIFASILTVFTHYISQRQIPFHLHDYKCGSGSDSEISKKATNPINNLRQLIKPLHSCTTSALASAHSAAVDNQIVTLNHLHCEIGSLLCYAPICAHTYTNVEI